MAWSSHLRFSTVLPITDSLTQSAGRQILLIIVLLCYHVLLQIDFHCPCASEQSFMQCYSYMLLPSLIISSLIIWNDRRLGRIFRFTCYHVPVTARRCCCRRKFCLEFVLYVLQAACSAFLWCGSVLVDGDWFLCCGTGAEAPTLACVKENQISPAQRMRRVDLKNQSMVLGLLCILLTAVVSLVLVLPWSSWCCSRNQFRAAFEEAILEQTEVIVWTEMDKAAAECVTNALDCLSHGKTTKNSKTSSISTSSKEENPYQDRPEDQIPVHLNMDVDWREVAHLADLLIESIPKNMNNNVNISIQNNLNIKGNA